jgi:hypothetical protein
MLKYCNCTMYMVLEIRNIAQTATDQKFVMLIFWKTRDKKHFTFPYFNMKTVGYTVRRQKTYENEQ